MAMCQFRDGKGFFMGDVSHMEGVSIFQRFRPVAGAGTALAFARLVMPAVTAASESMAVLLHAIDLQAAFTCHPRAWVVLAKR
jgi:hypothetical protein